MRTRFWRRTAFKESLTGWLCAAPILVYLSIFVFGPILASLVMVFFRWDGFGSVSKAVYVGLGNYREALADGRYLVAFRNTFAYAVVVVGISVPLGLSLALALNRINRFAGLIRSIYYVPVMLPVTAMSLLWLLIYQPRYGLANQILQSLGLPTFGWLIDPRIALLAISLMVIWKGLGWYVIIFLAGLKSIPEQLYEAARIDGANGWQQFWGITLPLLKPTTLFVLVMSIIGSLQVFSPVYIMTRGGPANATNVVVYWIYMTAFEFRRFGYAATQATLLFMAIFLITVAQMRLLREGGLVSYA